MPPSVSYIVSAFDRPKSLRCLLSALQIQTDPSLEVIVADNGVEMNNRTLHKAALYSLYDPRFGYAETYREAEGNPGWDCYWAAEWVVKHRAQGEWLCFPSDDSYYVPVFQEVMLAAARAQDLDLVYCEMLYDRRIGGKYSVINVEPRVDHIDKTGFLVKREKFIPFPAKNTEVSGPSNSDGRLIEALIQQGIRHGKVSEVLAVHN